MQNIITRENLLSLISYGLQNQNPLISTKNKTYRIKDLKVINVDNIYCSYYTEYTDTIDIKTEISCIMANFNGYFRSGGFNEIGFDYYCISALDESNNELIYAISSKDTAELIGEKAIEWLRLTYFQENTNEFRVSQAKTIISEIENTLREIIAKILDAKHSENWWLKSVDTKLNKSTTNMYERSFGEKTSNGKLLINHTFILDLKDIISNNWEDFYHLFKNSYEFEQSMIKLNEIRREEAHNRPISHQNLDELQIVHNNLLSRIFELCPTNKSNYLIENWQRQIQKIFIINSANYSRTEETDTHSVESVIKNSEKLINYLSTILFDLKSVIVPIQKKKHHDKLIELYDNAIDLEKNRIESAKNGGKCSNLVIERDKLQKIEMNAFFEEHLKSL
jgi:hypothetical protein